mgnify:FL=1
MTLSSGMALCCWAVADYLDPEPWLSGSGSGKTAPPGREGSYTPGGGSADGGVGIGPAGKRGSATAGLAAGLGLCQSISPASGAVLHPVQSSSGGIPSIQRIIALLLAVG